MPSPLENLNCEEEKTIEEKSYDIVDKHFKKYHGSFENDYPNPKTIACFVIRHYHGVVPLTTTVVVSLTRSKLQMRMKAVLSPKLREDASLFNRFLKARDFDVNKAEKMLLKHITWRKIYQADSIVKDFKARPFFQKYIEPSVFGYDKDGDMLGYSATGKLSINDVFNCVKMHEFMKYWTWFGERIVKLQKQHNEEEGLNSHQASLIMDLDKLTIANATSKLSTSLFLRFTQLYQDNYPERMKSLYLINAPAYYVFIFSILKNVMSNAMVKKIHIYGRSGWQEKLLEFIDADVLPAFLGGNRTDPDGNPLCKTFICHGGVIPEKYFITEEERYFRDRTKTKKIVIPYSEKEKINFCVKEEGTLLEWEFLVKGKDIGFGLFLQESDLEFEEVIPVQKYDTFDGTEKGSYRCQAVGKYIFLFDNSYSWLSTKEVEYCITVSEPDL